MLSKNKEDDAIRTFQQLQPLHVFGWLLKEPGRKLASTWTNESIAPKAIMAVHAISKATRKSGGTRTGTIDKSMVSALFAN